MKFLIPSAISLVLLSGCAHPVVERCDVDCPHEGVVFERPQIYLQVDKDCVFKAIPLPDPSQKYVLRVEGWLGDTTLTPTLTDGWNLTALTAGTNNAQTFSTIVGAAQGASKIAALFHAGGAICPNPGLYKFVNDKLVPMK